MKKLWPLMVAIAATLALCPALSYAEGSGANNDAATLQAAESASADGQLLATQSVGIVEAVYLTYDVPAAGATAPTSVAMSVEPEGAVSATMLGVEWMANGRYEDGLLYYQEETLAESDAFQAGYMYYPIFNTPTPAEGYYLDDTTEVYINGEVVGTYIEYAGDGTQMPGYFYGPLVEDATTPIASYNLVVDEPVVGETPDTTASVTFTLSDGTTVAAASEVNVEWTEYATNDGSTSGSVMGSSSTFQAGKYYWVSDIYEVDEDAGSYSIGAFEMLPDGCYYNVFEDTYSVYVNGAAQALFGPLEAEGSYTLTYTYDDTNLVATVTGYDGDAGGDLTIPETTTKDGTTYTVTAIGASAFSSQTAFTGTLTLPDTLATIGSSAFNGCANLSGTLTIPASVTSIGSNAFQLCSSFTALEFEDGENALAIGTCAFYSCSKFAGALTIPARATSIGDSAFYQCTKLTSLAFASGSQLASIGNSAFYYCQGLSGDLTLPDNVTTIGQQAFCYCNGITGKLTLPSGVTSIGQQAFARCSFTGNLVIPGTLSTFGKQAFYDAGTFSNVTLGEGLTTIGQSAFALTYITGTLTIPSTITEIPARAFWVCKFKGENLTIPGTVKTIGEYAFDSFGVDNDEGTLTYTGTITLSEGLETIGASAFNGSCFSGALVIPDSVTSIGEKAFCDAKYFTSLTLPENEAFTTIPTMAFGTSNTSTWGAYTMGLTGTVVIPANVTTIEERAFQDNRYVQSFSFADDSKLASIGDYAFYHCGLEASTPGELALPDSLTTIGNYAFYYCGFTGDLAIPDSVTSMGAYAFFMCTGFNGTLSLPKNTSFTVVPEGAFRECSGIVGPLALPSQVTTIGKSAFDGCSSLTATITGDANVLDGIEYIGDYAFYYCNAFADTLTIPESVTYLGAYSFGNCSGITALDMHQSDTTLRNAFKYCQNLVSIGEIPSTVTEIGDEAFYNCYALEGDGGSFAIPEGVTTIGSEVFFDCRKLTGTVTIPSTVTSLNSYALYTSHFTTIVNNSDQTLPAAYAKYSSADYFVDENGTAVETIAKGTYTLVTGEEPAATVDLATATVTVAGATYTGSALKPAVTVKVGDTTLTAGTHYTLAYSNNTNAGTGKVTVTGIEAGGYTGSVSKNFTISAKPATPTVTLAATSYTYSGAAKKPGVTVKVGAATLKAGTDYALAYSNNTNAGTATVTVKLKGNYSGSKAATFTIVKAANSLSAKGKTATVKYAKVKKKAQALAATKAVKFSSKGQGTLTYAKKSGNKKIVVNKKTGKVTVKKGLAKGTYKVKVAVRAAGDANHNAKTVTVTFKVKVK